MLSIIIPIYLLNKKLERLTYQCIKSIDKYTKDFEIIIIDNKPHTEFTLLYERVAHYRKDFTHVANKKNVGIGAAWNQGVALAKGEYVCLMNNDVEVTKDWSKDLIKILQDKRVAVVFPLTKNKEDDDYFERLAGFCWIIRKELFNQLGRIDEIFGIANFEDSDFYMRAKSKGYLLKCSNKSKIIHYSRATCDKVKEVSKLYAINEKIYFDRWKVLPLLD